MVTRFGPAGLMLVCGLVAGNVASGFLHGQATATRPKAPTTVPAVTATSTRPALTVYEGDRILPQVVGPDGRIWCYRHVENMNAPTLQQAQDMIRAAYVRPEPHLVLVVPLLVEKSGRLWCALPGKDTVIGYDGNTFITHQLKTHGEFTNARVQAAYGRPRQILAIDGAVFFATQEGVDVYDGMEWSRQEIGAARVWLSEEPDGKGLVAISENLVELKRWRKEPAPGAPAGWSDLFLGEGQQVRGNSSITSVGVTSKGAWMLAPTALYYAPFDAGKALRPGVSDGNIDVGSFHVRGPLCLLTLADKSLALGAERYAEGGPADADNRQPISNLGPWKKGLLRIDATDETVRVLGDEAMLARVQAPRQGMTSPLTLVETADGKQVWSIDAATGSRPLLLDGRTLQPAAMVPISTPAPYMALPDGTLVTLSYPRVIRYNPFGLDNRVLLSPQVMIPGASAPFATGDGNLWMTLAAPGKPLVFARFDGRRAVAHPGVLSDAPLRVEHVGKHAFILKSNKSWALVTEDQAVEAKTFEEILAGHTALFVRQFEGATSPGTIECDARGAIWMAAPAMIGGRRASIRVFADGKWIDATEMLAEKVPYSLNRLAVYPVAGRSRMYVLTLSEGHPLSAHAFWATIAEGAVKLEDAPTLPISSISGGEMLRDPDGSLWLAGSRSNSGWIARNAGANVLSPESVFARLRGPDELTDRGTGALPVTVDSGGNLWVVTPESSTNAFGVWRDDTLLKVESRVWNSADLYAGQNGTVYAVFPLGIREFKPVDGAPGKFVEGKFYVTETPWMSQRFCAAHNAFFTAAAGASESSVSITLMPR